MINFWHNTGLGNDGKAYAGLKSLTTKNGGFFKSKAQAYAIYKANHLGASFYWENDSSNKFRFSTAADATAELKRKFNVDADFSIGQRVIILGGTLHFAVNPDNQIADTSRELRGNGRPFSYVFVVDQHGVVSLSKLKYKFVGRGACAPVPEKTQLVFSRDPSAQLPEWDLVAEDAARKARWEEEHNAADAAPVGRVKVEGTVMSTKIVESQFGCVLKALVKLNTGAKVYGSVPSCSDWAKGDVVSFTATFEQSKDDAKFGFYKRPTKPEIIKAAE